MDDKKQDSEVKGAQLTAQDTGHVPTSTAKLPPGPHVIDGSPVVVTATGKILWD